MTSDKCWQRILKYLSDYVYSLMKYMYLDGIDTCKLTKTFSKLRGILFTFL